MNDDDDDNNGNASNVSNANNESEVSNSSISSRVSSVTSLTATTATTATGKEHEHDGGNLMRRHSHKRHKSLDFSISDGSKEMFLSSKDTLSPGEKPLSGAKFPTRPGSPLRNSIILEEEETKEKKDEPEAKQEDGKKEDKELKESDQFVKSTLGYSINDGEYSETILKNIITLKTEQEKTKKESLKLSSIKSSISLMKLAIESGIQPNLIPLIFLSGQINQLNKSDKFSKELNNSIDFIKSELASNLNSANSNANSAMDDNSNLNTPKSQTSVFKVNLQQPQTQFQFHHWQKPDGSAIDSTDDRKRKMSGEREPEHVPQQQQHQHQPQQSMTKPSTPRKQLQREEVYGHRRNQSEASVMQLRNIYENPQQYQSHQINRGLGSPYYPRNEPRPPPPPSHQQQQQHQAPPFPSYSFPPRGAPNLSPLRVNPPHHPSHAPQVQAQAHQPHPAHAPPAPHTQVPPHHPQQRPLPVPPYVSGGFSSANSSPVTTRLPNSNTSQEKKIGKSDVNFLISTPNNPPR